jgi:hypothetical protein
MYHLEGSTSDQDTTLLAALYASVKTKWQGTALSSAAAVNKKPQSILHDQAIRPQISRSATSESVQEKR